LKSEFYLKFQKTLCNTHFEAQILSQNPKPTLQLPLWNPKKLSLIIQNSKPSTKKKPPKNHPPLSLCGDI
jgi:hypothetical protein